MSAQMIVEKVWIVRAKTVPLFRMDYASNTYTVKHLTSFAEGSSENMSDYCEKRLRRHRCVVGEIVGGYRRI